MFNVLVQFNDTAWETDQLMRMDAAGDRFKTHCGGESDGISSKKPGTLKKLEGIDTLLVYEDGSASPSVNIVRYGRLTEVKLVGEELVFKFKEEGKFSKSVVKEFSDRLDITPWEFNRTHWAIKDGGIPTAMMAKMKPSYDLVFSFAGEDRKYVEAVAEFLRLQDNKVFYDEYEQAELWGKDLAEHFDFVYSHSSQYCVIFISGNYLKKMWTRHERRSALSRALLEEQEYILPARFDKTEVPGIRPTVAYIDLVDKSPKEFGEIILKKLGKPVTASTQKGKSDSIQATVQPHVVRIPKNIPSSLPRIASGKVLVGLVNEISAHHFDHDDDLSESEVELVGGFIQELSDWIDIISEIQPLERVRLVRHGQELIKQLEKQGFFVFGAKEFQTLEGGVGPPSPWTILHLSVRRRNDPQIILKPGQADALRQNK